jgi:hypothetical protein
MKQRTLRRLFGSISSSPMTGEEMAKRGKVLRDPLAGPGLLIAEGRQYQFVLEGTWKSDIPPKPGLVVDIELDAQGRLAGITAVPDLQLAQEHELTIGADKRRTFASALALFVQSGMAHLIAVGLLILSWFFLIAISVEGPLTGTFELTFWQLLRHLGFGTYGLLAFIAMIGPLLHHFWRHRRAALGGLLPLSFMVIIGAALVRNIDVFLGNGGDGLYQLPTHARAELISAISLGPGTYVSIVISVSFAVLSVKQLRQSKQNEKKEIGQLQSAAA